MMLSTYDIMLIGLTAVVCTVVTTLVVIGVLRIGRGWSLGVQIGVVVAGSVGSIVASTAAISAEMYLSPHDLQVLLWVIGIAAVLSLATAAFTARIARRSFDTLSASLRRVGEGEVVTVEPAGGREFVELSGQLADTSRRLVEARGELERLDASRRQFFAWISHDLRTPLTGISALSEALEEGAVDDPASYLRQIQAQVGAMNRLVDDLFNLSQIQNGALRLHIEEVELRDVISDAVADVRSLAEARGIVIAPAGVEGHFLRADPHELTRVVVNLLTNSIRHAPTDSEVLVTAERLEDRVVVSVLDRGSGVDSNDLPHIFDVGWRAAGARTREAPETGSPGAGLGLAIVRGIVDAHGGEVGAENLDPGFRLDVTLPATSCPTRA